jgi:hypothetical protein
MGCAGGEENRMEIKVLWHKPMPLADGDDQNLTYRVDGLKAFEGIAGVYMFSRVYGQSLTPLYIGKALNLAALIKQQLNTVKLMNAVGKSRSGAKVLVIGEFQCKHGQTVDKCIRLVERAVIEHALAKGLELVNQKGTKTPYHEINFVGNTAAKSFTGRQIYLKK